MPPNGALSFTHATRTIRQKRIRKLPFPLTASKLVNFQIITDNSLSRRGARWNQPDQRTLRPWELVTYFDRSVRLERTLYSEMSTSIQHLQEMHRLEYSKHGKQSSLRSISLTLQTGNSSKRWQLKSTKMDSLWLFSNRSTLKRSSIWHKKRQVYLKIWDTKESLWE